jgi:demethylmenaquinone methyltransferase/2-methoxy-6-polyprenyl-1,4-benzoquinol methylase
MTAKPALPQGAAKVRAVDDMFDRIAPRYDLLNRMLTFGMDVGWRRRTVAALGLPRRSRILDVACGTGDLCRELQSSGYEAIGVDRSAGMLGAARTSAPLVRGDGLFLPFADSSIDGIVCGFALRNFADLGSFFADCGRVLRDGGRVALLEVSVPANPALRLGHSMYFGRVVPLVGGLLSDRAAYQYLPKSVAYLPEEADLLRMLEDAGFPDARRTSLSVGIAQLLTGTRRR